MLFYYLFKKIYFVQGIQEKIKSKFEFWNSDILPLPYRTYFLDTLIFQDFYYTT